MYLGSTPGSASKYLHHYQLTSLVSTPDARVVKLVDTRDLKSLDRNGRAGSSPAPGTIFNFIESKIKCVNFPSFVPLFKIFLMPI